MIATQPPTDITEVVKLILQDLYHTSSEHLKVHVKVCGLVTAIVLITGCNSSKSCLVRQCGLNFYGLIMGLHFRISC